MAKVTTKVNPRTGKKEKIIKRSNGNIERVGGPGRIAKKKKPLKTPKPVTKFKRGTKPAPKVDEKRFKRGPKANPDGRSVKTAAHRKAISEGLKAYHAAKKKSNAKAKFSTAKSAGVKKPKPSIQGGRFVFDRTEGKHHFYRPKVGMARAIKVDVKTGKQVKRKKK
jgi:hypothetical protein